MRLIDRLIDKVSIKSMHQPIKYFVSDIYEMKCQYRMYRAKGCGESFLIPSLGSTVLLY